MPGKKIARKRPGSRCEADLALRTARALPPPFLLWLVAYCTFSTPPCTCKKRWSRMKAYSHVIVHTSRVLRSWRLWPCRFDYFQADRAAPGIYVAHAQLGNHGLVEMPGEFRTLALCCYVSSRIASACARKTRLPDAGSRRRQILI